MKKVTVLSGKGGTGKTTILASLACLMAKKQRVVVADCDVEEPNLALLFGVVEKDMTRENISASNKAFLINERCTRCKKCLDSCVYSAISWNDKPALNRFLCTGCGACTLVCPESAIKLKQVTNAWIGVKELTEKNIGLVTGQVFPGESGSGEVVNFVREKSEKLARNMNAKTIFLDAPAGIGCPMIASVAGVDYVIGVTEPSPPAFRDLRKALTVVEHFGISYGLVINKVDLNKSFARSMRKFAKSNKIPILGELPYDKTFIDSLINLKPIVEYKPEFEIKFMRILEHFYKLMD